MKTRLLGLTILFWLLGVVAPVARAAMPEPPPRWAVGTFRGTNRKYRLNVELRVDGNGIVRRWTWKRGENRGEDFVEGGWENGEIVFVGDRFRVERTGGGMVTTKESDRDDITDLRRVGGGIIDRGPGPDRNPPGGRSEVPSWAMGTFRGSNRKYKLEVELSISRSGSVERSIWKGREKPETATGKWDGGEIVFGGDHYLVTQTIDGIRTEKRGDKSDVTNLRRR